MELKRIDRENTDLLFGYWKKIGENTPYFYETCKEEFDNSLFEDTFNGERILNDNYIYAAVEENSVIGFIQYGIPGFYFENWKMVSNPNIGIVRNIYFKESRNDIGRELLKLALRFFEERKIVEIYGFYHAMGMSCNGNHGKLHECYQYIGKLLTENGFEIEHENVYYTLNMKKNEIKSNISISVYKENYKKEKIELICNGENVGGAEVKFIDNYTGIPSNKIIYLVWIYVIDKVKGKGIGSQFMALIQNYYISKGYKTIHTDTGIDNVIAQRYYERNGFTSEGLTRSYQRLND